MTRTPVARAVSTGRRPSAAGGAQSTGTHLKPVGASRPSIGRPRPSKTRPSSAEPAPISSPLPVDSTIIIRAHAGQLTERHDQRLAVGKTHDLGAQRLTAAMHDQHIAHARAGQGHAQHQARDSDHLAHRTQGGRPSQARSERVDVHGKSLPKGPEGWEAFVVGSSYQAIRRNFGAPALAAWTLHGRDRAQCLSCQASVNGDVKTRVRHDAEEGPEDAPDFNKPSSAKALARIVRCRAPRSARPRCSERATT